MRRTWRAACAALLGLSVVQRLPAVASDASSYLHTSLVFEKEQTGAHDSYVARSAGFAIALEDGKATLRKSTPGQAAGDAIALEFARGRKVRAVPEAEPGKINIIHGSDPRAWRTGLQAWKKVAYPGIYPDVDVAWYGNQNRIEFDLVLKPGADPRAIRMKFSGARRLWIDAAGALRIGDDGLTIALPAIYQETAGKRIPVSGRFKLMSHNTVGFDIGQWDRSQALVIDPAIVFSTNLGGDTNASTANAVAVDSAGNTYVAGVTEASDFPTTGAFQPALGGTTGFNSNGFVAKLDPTGAVIWSTYIGGSHSDGLNGIAVDSSGNVWVTGYAASSDFPLVNATQPFFAGGASDAVVVQLNSSGIPQFSTYIGGNGYDTGFSIAVDPNGNAYATGYTLSANFPACCDVLQNSLTGSQNAFVVKYSSSGSLGYATYLGGTGIDYGYSIAADSAGSAYVTGSTTSSTFTGAPGGGAATKNNGSASAFVAKLNSTGSALSYFTFFGAKTAGASGTWGNSIALDSSRNAYIGGTTNSGELPVTSGVPQSTLNGASNGFIAILNPAGTSFTYVTYIGGNRIDLLNGLSLDGQGNVWVTGSTDSSTFPSVNPVGSLPGNTVGLAKTANTGGSFAAFDSKLPGAATGFTADPSTSGKLVAATWAGVFLSTNAGTSWTQELSTFNFGMTGENEISGGLFNTPLAPVFLARSPANSSTIYAVFGNQTFQSTNGGSTWSAMGVLPFGVYYAPGIVADPKSAQTAYAYSIGGGVYITTNGGQNWSSTASSPSGGVLDLAISPDGILWAGNGNPSTPLFSSSNQGASWTGVSMLGLSSVTLGPESIAVAGTSGSPVVYVAAGAVYKTTNAGTSWTTEGTPGLGAVAIAASPLNPSLLYAADLVGRVYVSSDSGAAWTQSTGTIDAGTESNINGQISALTQFAFDPTEAANAWLIAPVARTGFLTGIQPGSGATSAVAEAATSLPRPEAGSAAGTGGVGNSGPLPGTAGANGVGGSANGATAAGTNCKSNASSSCPGTPNAVMVNVNNAALPLPHCDYALTPEATITPWGGNTPGGHTVVMASATGGPNCSFQLYAGMGSEWLGFTQGLSGLTGTATVQVLAKSNNSTPFVRYGAIYLLGTQPLGGFTFLVATIAQNPTNCQVGAQGPSAHVPAAGGVTQVTVSSPNGPCLFTAVSLNPGVTVAPGSGAVGIAVVNVLVPQNPGLYQRPITVVVNPGVLFITIIQNGQTLPPKSPPTPGGGGPSPTQALAGSETQVIFTPNPVTQGYPTTVRVSVESTNPAIPIPSQATASLTCSGDGPQGTVTLTNGLFSEVLRPNLSIVCTAMYPGDAQHADSSGSARLSVISEGSTGFEAADNIPTGTGTSFATSLVPSGGNPSVVASNAVGINVIPGNGDGTFQTGVPTNLSYSPTCVTPFYQGLQLYVVLCSQDPPSVNVYLVTGSNTLTPVGNSITLDPVAVAAADLNGDGNVDLAAVNPATGSVDVLLGNGDGTFQNPAPYQVGTTPSGVAIADVNEDGIPDLAVSNSGSDNVSVLLGFGDGTFQAATSTPAGTMPSGIAINDFNNDGIPDLVTSNSGDNDVTVMLGNGDGTFQSPAPWKTGTTPAAVVAFDLNGDGIPDIATANSGSGNVSVLLGKGNATFQNAASYNVGTTPISIVVSEFNGDGRPDLLVANSGSGNVSILFGAAGAQAQTITFGAIENVAYGAPPFPVPATASSGLPVLLGPTTPSVCGAAGTTVIILGAGTCTLTAQQEGNASFAPATPVTQSFTVLQASQTITFGTLQNQTGAAAPFDISASASSGLPVAFTSNSTAVCTVSGITVTLVGAGTCSITASQAGNANFLAAAPVTQTFSVITFSQTITFNPPNNQPIATATFSVSASSTSGLTVVFTSTTTVICTVSGTLVTIVATGTCSITASQPGNGAFSAATPVTNNISVVVTASTQLTLTTATTPSEFGTEATLTAAITPAPTSGSLLFYSGTTVLGAAPISNGIATLNTLLLPPGGQSLSARFPGVAGFTASASGTVAQTVNATAGSGFSGDGHYDTGNSTGAIAVGDFNNDGNLDVAVCNLSTGTVDVMLGNGNGTYQKAVTYQIGTQPLGVVVSDFNGDGVPDLAVINGFGSGTTGVLVLLGNGNGTFQTAVGYNGGTLPRGIAVADFNGDGYADLAVTDAPGGVSILLGNGDGTFAIPASYGTGSDPTSVAVGDFNGDGVPDLVVANTGDTTVSVLLGKGDGTFQTAVPYDAVAAASVSGTIKEVAVADFRGDGNLDVAVAGSEVVVLLGNGDGTFQTAATLDANANMGIVAVSDFNGDGTPDLAAYDWTTGLLHVLQGNGDGTFTLETSKDINPGPLGNFAVWDINGDGRADFLVTANGVSSLLATDTGTTQTITFGSLSNQNVGATVPPLSATATSNLTVMFVSGSPSVCTISGVTATLVGGGTCSIIATQPGNATYAAAAPVTQSFTVSAGSQTITFGALSDVLFGVAPFSISASSTSGLPVSFVSTTQTVCTVSGSTVTIVSAGPCSITASQAGNGAYNAASPVIQGFNVNPGNQTITFAALNNVSLNAAPFTISATASSGLTVSFNSLTQLVCTVSGTTVTILTTGQCQITASQNGSSNYNAASSVTQSFNVTGGSQTITFGTLSNQPFSLDPFAVSATATSGLPVIFTSTTPLVCTVTGQNVTLTGVGLCSITASQPGNGTWSAATSVIQIFTVSKAGQVISFAPTNAVSTSTPPFALSAAATSGLTITFVSNTTKVCTVSGGIVTLVGSGTCSITASQSGSANFSAATSVTQTFSVFESQTITFGALSNVVLGTKPITIKATASSGLTVTFASNSETICTVSGTTVTLLSGGTCSIMASQAGNTTFAAANPVTQTFTVLLTQTITFPVIGNQDFGTSPFAPPVSASSGLAVTLVSTTTSVCTVSSGTITLVAAGKCSITASQSGNAEYTAATSVTQSFTVLKTQTISFAALSNQTVGTTPPALKATATSGLTVTFSSTTASICTVSGTTVKLVTDGLCTIAANQGGNTAYAPAPQVTQSFTVFLSQKITFNTIASQPNGGMLTLTATASSDLAVTYASTTQTVCTVVGDETSFIALGTCSIMASQAGNGTYAAATSVTQTFKVLKAQTITFGELSNEALGAKPFALSATASSGLAVTYASNSTKVCTVSGVNVTLLAGGTCSITASQAGNATYAAATQVTQTFTVTVPAALRQNGSLAGDQ